MKAEGDIYQLHGVAQSVLSDFARIDGFINKVIQEEGLEKTAERFASILRKRCGNEDSQTFTITAKQLEQSLYELRSNLIVETMEILVKKGHLVISIDREGNICFNEPKGAMSRRSESDRR